MYRVDVWVYDGCSAGSVMGVVDTLLTANLVWAYINREQRKVKPILEWRIESADGMPVRSASGYMLQVDGAIGAHGRPDAVVLPALFMHDVESLLENLLRLRRLGPFLHAVHSRGTLIGACCTSAFVVAEAGLLDGRRATVQWHVAKVFKRRYPRVDLRTQETHTEHDGILCAAGAAYAKLTLRLVEKLAGIGIATATAQRLLVDANSAPSGTRGETMLQDAIAQNDPLVTRAQHWMQDRLKEPFRLARLASDLGVSERTVGRRFSRALGQTPVAYLQTLRIETGKRFLETTKMSIESVAELVGYADVNFFRRVFKRKTGLLPREYHHRFLRRRSA